MGPFCLPGLEVKGGLVRDGGWAAGNQSVPFTCMMGWGWVGIANCALLGFNTSPWGKRGLGWAWPTASSRRQSWEPLLYQGHLWAGPASSRQQHPMAHSMHSPAVLWPTLVLMWARRNFSLFVCSFCFKVIVSYIYINIRQCHCHRAADFFSSWPGFDRGSCVSIESFPH